MHRSPSLRQSLKAMYHRGPRRWYMALRTVNNPRERWQSGIRHEVEFWRDYLTHPDLDADFTRRLDPSGAITDPLLVAALESIEAPHASILDVGAGPVSAVGQKFPGKTISLTAVDPLAPTYDALLAEARLTPPTPTGACEAEQLSGRFAPGTFDIAYARNALDHSHDPLRAIREMHEVVKPGGWILLRHYLQEGENGHYGGLHQWNFDCVRGQFTIWGAGVEYHVADALTGVDIRTEVGIAGGRHEVTCQIRKRLD